MNSEIGEQRIHVHMNIYICTESSSIYGHRCGLIYVIKLFAVERVCVYGELLLLYSCLMHTKGMAQATKLWQWRPHYFSLVVRWSMKLCFTLVGQARWGDGYRFVTVCTHGDFIMLPHWNTRLLAPFLLSYSVTLSWHWTNQSLPYYNNAEHQAREWQL